MPPDKQPPEWSDEQKRLLNHERFQAEVLRLRGNTGEKAKPAWQRFLQSTGGAALVTVLIGGLLGNWVADGLEESRARNQRAYLTHKEYLEARLNTINAALDRIGFTLKAAEDLITLTRSDWNPASFPVNERERVLSDRRKIRSEYNQADSSWRSQRTRLGYLLAYYHPGTSVGQNWSNLDSELSAYLDCARRWYLDNVNSYQKDTSDVCAHERARVEENLDLAINELGGVTPAVLPITLASTD